MKVHEYTRNTVEPEDQSNKETELHKVGQLVNKLTNKNVTTTQFWDNQECELLF